MSRRELRRYERGRTVSESDLRSIAGSCGVDVADLVSSSGVGGNSDAAFDDHGRDWDTEWLDTRIDEFLSSDEVDPPYLEIQLMLWDRGSRIWPEPVDAQFPGYVQLTLFDLLDDELVTDEADAAESLPVVRRRHERPLREFGRVQVAT